MRGLSPLSILYVAYPLLTVSEDSAGGAEQMLLTLEREVAQGGHRTTVAAARGSQGYGELLDTGLPAAIPDRYEHREIEHTNRVLAYLDEQAGRFDLIHDESGSFWHHAAECNLPVLATLHLPRSFYPEQWFDDLPSNLFFNCVSESQAQTFADLPNLAAVVQNGISCEKFPFGGGKQEYLLWLGRICEEKAPHLAIEAAQRAGLPLVLAGQVYPFRYHQEYFRRQIAPHVSASSAAGVRFVESPGFEEKAKLLRHARAVLLTSTAEETSSLVAMEAMACGTPVVAFRKGAFPEIVSDGVTGFVVDSVEEMAAAIARVAQISPAECRRRVEEHFSGRRMADEYERLYRSILLRSEARSVA